MTETAASEAVISPAMVGHLLSRKRPLDNGKLNKWLTLLANISVVAGIIFLGIEVRQNTQTLEQNALYMRLALMDVGYEQTTNWRNMLVADEDARNLWDKGCKTSLTDEEAINYDYLSTTWLIQHRNLFDRASVLGGDEAANLMADSTARQVVNCQYLRDKFFDQKIHFVISPKWKPAVADALARLDAQE